MTGPCRAYSWHAEEVLQNGRRLPLPPIRQLGFQSTYTIQPRSNPGDPSALLQPLPMYLSQTPPGGRRFVENKGKTPIRPNGHRAVEALFLRNFEPALGCLVTRPVRLGFQRSLYRLRPERWQILTDLRERIKSELSETADQACL